MPHTPVTTATEDALRRSGLRVTSTRVAVLEALQGMPHARADEVLERVRPVLAHTSLQSVYNALGDFTSAGLVRRIEPAGHPGLFELRVDDNHHHLVCRSCGTVVDVDCAVGEVPCLTAADDQGFVIDEAEVTYWGRCPSCAAHPPQPV